MGLRERLTEIRDALGSNAELARAAGITRSNATQWVEGDVKSLKAITALNLEEKTGFSARWIVFGSGHKKVSGNGLKEIPDEKRNPAESDEQKLLEIIRIFQDTDRLGRDAIWAGTQSALKRIAKHPKEKRFTPAIRR